MLTRARRLELCLIVAAVAGAVAVSAYAATHGTGAARPLVSPVPGSTSLPTYGLTPPTPGQVETLTYGSGAVARPFLVYTPQSYSPSHKMPLMVVLHGCAVTATEQMDATGFNQVADQDGFVVLYPDVTNAEVHQAGGNALCWEYYNPSDWRRGEGDPAAVVGMVRSVIDHWAIDGRRVYVVGMSSGSFLVSDLAATYPDVFAAVAEDAGGAYEDWACVTGMTSQISISASAQNAFAEEQSRSRVIPELVIGGDIDDAVPASCATKALLQQLRTDNLVLDASQTKPIPLQPTKSVEVTPTSGYSYTIRTYALRGCPVGVRYLVHGMKHFWSGGSSDPSLRWITDPSGPSAAVASWQFMSRFTLSTAHDPCSP